MSSEDGDRASAGTLRRRAEAQWHDQSNDAEYPPPAEDVLRLLHELQVHQIELELQNEELCQQRARLEQSLAKYADLYDFAPVGYFTVSGNGTIREVNLAGATLLGHVRKDLLARRLSPFMTDATRPRFFHLLEQVIKHGTRATCEVSVVSRDAVTRALHLEGIGVDTDEGRLCRLAATDISARKLAEDALRAAHDELERRVADRTAELVHSRDELALANAELVQALHLKADFLATMSHELRTPLSAILGLTELLTLGVYGVQTERAQRSLEKIESSGRHLLGLINDLLDVEKIEAGKLELRLEAIGVHAFAVACLSMVEELARARRQQVAFHVEPVDLTIEADPQRLKQILVNLLSNAVKFTPQGGHIGLDIAADVAGQSVRFAVWDDGIGIAAEDLDRLFKPFVQLDARLARAYEGTGLGLLLVRRLAELHGGTVTLASRPGEGSRFTVTLPWRSLATGAPHTLAPPSSAPDTPPDAGNALLLLVDDNDLSREMLSDYLVAQRFRVLRAANGVEAVAKVGAFHPQLVVMDVQMPDMDGITATIQIRQLADPELAAVPIVGLTALAMPGDKERCLHAGMDCYLSKPVSLAALTIVIRQLLETGRAQDCGAH
jgi:PAS domain S-box-containing protein